MSLSYEIIKAHGGEIKVETKEGKGGEFIMQLDTKETLQMFLKPAILWQYKPYSNDVIERFYSEMFFIQTH